MTSDKKSTDIPDPSEATDILEPPVEVFIEFMKFISDNDLWEKARRRLADENIYNVQIGRRQIETFREFIAETLLAGPEARKEERVEAMKRRCGCGGTPPASPHQVPEWENPGHWHQ